MLKIYKINKYKKGFTLVELLVVVGIIIILSSITLLSLGEAREKARLARSQQLSANIRHSLGAYSAGEWGFEEQTGATAYDQSGNRNNGIIHDNEGADWVDGIMSGTSALRFDGVDDYVEIPASASLHIRRNLVWELWFKADQVTGASRTLIDQESNLNFLQLNNGKIWFNLVGTGGAPIATSPTTRLESDASIVPGRWCHLVAAYDGVKMYLYIDGVLDNETATTGADVGPNCDTVVTSIGGSLAPFFDGVIDQVAFYEGSL
jgi:prepilin-type N-terminal cleavage/methylation domain-containing protein